MAQFQGIHSSNFRLVTDGLEEWLGLFLNCNQTMKFKHTVVKVDGDRHSLKVAIRIRGRDKPRLKEVAIAIDPDSRW